MMWKQIFVVILLDMGTNMAYNYYNRTGGSYSYNYHKGYGNVLYNDITDPNDMAVTVGMQWLKHIWGSSSSSSS